MSLPPIYRQSGGAFGLFDPQDPTGLLASLGFGQPVYRGSALDDAIARMRTDSSGNASAGASGPWVLWVRHLSVPEGGAPSPLGLTPSVQPSPSSQNSSDTLNLLLDHLLRASAGQSALGKPLVQPQTSIGSMPIVGLGGDIDPMVRQTVMAQLNPQSWRRSHFNNSPWAPQPVAPAPVTTSDTGSFDANHWLNQWVIRQAQEQQAQQAQDRLALRSTNPAYVGSDQQAWDAATDDGQVAAPNTRRTSVLDDYSRAYQGLERLLGGTGISLADLGSGGSVTSAIPDEDRARIDEALGTWFANASGIGDNPASTGFNLATLGLLHGLAGLGGSTAVPGLSETAEGVNSSDVGEQLRSILESRGPSSSGLHPLEEGLYRFASDSNHIPDGSTIFGKIFHTLRDWIPPRSPEHAISLVQGRPRERGWLFPADGSRPIHVDQMASPNEIDLARYRDFLPGATVVHNHPDEFFFGSQDVRAFAHNKIARSLVVTPEGQVWEMLANPAHNVSPDDLADALQRANFTAMKEFHDLGHLGLRPSLVQLQAGELGKILRSESPFSDWNIRVSTLPRSNPVGTNLTRFLRLGN